MQVPLLVAQGKYLLAQVLAYVPSLTSKAVPESSYSILLVSLQTLICQRAWHTCETEQYIYTSSLTCHFTSRRSFPKSAPETFFFLFSLFSTLVLSLCLHALGFLILREIMQS